MVQTVAVLLFSKSFYIGIIMNSQLKLNPKIMKWVKLFMCQFVAVCYYISITGFG